MAVKEPTGRTVQAFARIIDGLPQLGGAIIALTGLGYIIGWTSANAYFAEFGAAWIVSELSPSRLLLQGAGLVSAIAVGFFIGLSYSHVANAAYRLDRVATTLTIVASIGAGLVMLVFDRWFDSSTLYYSSVSAGLSLALAAGLTAASLVLSYRDSRYAWKDWHIAFGYVVFTWGALYAPQHLAGATGRRDADPHQSPLPRVTIGAEPHGDMRLLTTLERELVIVEMDSTTRVNHIRLVSPTDTVRIEARRRGW